MKKRSYQAVDVFALLWVLSAILGAGTCTLLLCRFLVKFW